MKKNTLILFLFFAFYQGFSQCTTIVEVDSVSVLPNGDVIIGWEPSPDIGVVSYDVFILNPFTFANDSLSSVNSTTYFYIIPYDTIVKYQITEVGIVTNCGFGISPLGSNYHNTMLLSQQIDICSATVNLTWNAYDDFATGLNVSYEVYININGGGFTSAGTTNSLTFNYSGLTLGTNYQFYVRAIENNGIGPFTSSTNIVNVSGNFLKNPNFLYLFTGSVVDSSQIQVKFYVDTTADIKTYEIKRALTDENIFTTIYSISDYPGMNPLIEYFDETVDAKNNSYTYKIDAVNQCNQLKITSNIAQTIKLTVVANVVTSTNQLNWSYYDGWQGNVKEYMIYRLAKDELYFSNIATISASSTVNTYIDDVSDDLQGSGEFCYKILAVEDNAIHVGNLPMAISASVEVCVKHEPYLYVANAFEPLSEFNPTFKPSAILFDLTSYQFLIFDRWGHKVFETNNRDEGWNGRTNNTGNNLPLGVYVYFIQFKSNSGEEFQKRGTVTLIR